MWPRSPADEKARLEADIVKVRAEQVAAQHQFEDAVCTELRSLAAVDASRAIQARARRLVEEDAQAISSLQDEIAALIPDSRDPVEP